ncbi:hypothetical protein RhiJN_16285 [Ceratobasidium sp. AG-Ba]|nr:hypothetical protein RhiJN_16285 [Ceratobasidium sp. AG-Ba]
MQSSNSIHSESSSPEGKAYISYQPTSSADRIEDNSSLSSPSQLSEIATTPEFGARDSEISPDSGPTKRDRLVGKVGKIVAKVTRDPELRDRAMLQEAGGENLAKGLEMVDSSTLLPTN